MSLEELISRTKHKPKERKYHPTKDLSIMPLSKLKLLQISSQNNFHPFALTKETIRIINYFSKGFSNRERILIEERINDIAANTTSVLQWTDICSNFYFQSHDEIDQKLAILKSATEILSKYSIHILRNGINATVKALNLKKQNWNRILEVVQDAPPFVQYGLLELSFHVKDYQFESFQKELSEQIKRKKSDFQLFQIESEIIREYNNFRNTNEKSGFLWHIYLQKYCQEKNLDFAKVLHSGLSSEFSKKFFLFPDIDRINAFREMATALLYEDIHLSIYPETTHNTGKYNFQTAEYFTPLLFTDQRLSRLILPSFKGLKEKHWDPMDRRKIEYPEIKNLQKNLKYLLELDITRKTVLAPAAFVGEIPQQKDIIESLDIALIKSSNKVKEMVGMGAQSRVYKVINAHQKRFAMKIYTSGNNKMALQEAKRLTETYDQDPHPNIVRFYFTSNDVTYNGVPVVSMFSEFVYGSTIEELVEKGVMNEEKITSFIGQMTSALKWMQKHNIFHRDLTDRNIMYDPFSNAFKIIDFGIAAEIETTPIHNPRYGGKTDFESLARLIYKIHTNELLPRENELKFLRENLPEQHANIAQAMFLHRKTDSLEPIYDSVMQMYLDRNPNGIDTQFIPSSIQSIKKTIRYLPDWFIYLTKPSERFEQ